MAETKNQEISGDVNYKMGEFTSIESFSMVNYNLNIEI